jgi:hypothetical protein
MMFCLAARWRPADTNRHGLWASLGSPPVLPDYAGCQVKAAPLK